jgi:hypothetical protein
MVPARVQCEVIRPEPNALSASLTSVGRMTAALFIAGDLFLGGFTSTSEI